MSATVDARGLICPQPVIQTRKAMEVEQAVTTLVDSENSMNNVRRMAEKAGWQVQVSPSGEGYRLDLARGSAALTPQARAALGKAEPISGPPVLVVASDRLGRGADELGGILMRGFFHALGEVSEQPQTVIFLNTGARLACHGSPVLEDLVALEAEGIEILVCGTCLSYLDLLEKLAVGQVSNMYDIAEKMMAAGKVVNLWRLWGIDVSMDWKNPKLTQLTKAAGWASKRSPDDLAHVLRPLRETFQEASFPNLLAGLTSPDDAAVWQVSDDQALILTTDFFTPVVDDPYTYGAVAAANAMSDVYAMGGQVLLALSIAAFPAKMPPEVAGAILKGAADKVAEAGGVIAGGHTVDDDEPKFGLAVLGTVHPRRVGRKAGARPGDVLLLTKRLGTGIITTAAKGGAADPAHLQAAVDSMLLLNRRAAELAQQVEFHAVTDITGFGLLGHALEMAESSGLALRFAFDRLPFLPGARDYAEQWLFPGGACNNQRTYQDSITFDDLAEEMQMLILTPETSGGLLVALPPAEAERYERLCRAAGQDVWRIGEAIEGSGIEVTRS